MSANVRALAKCIELLDDELANSCEDKWGFEMYLKFRGTNLRYLGSVHTEATIEGSEKVGIYSLSFMSVCCALCKNYTDAIQLFHFFKAYWVYGIPVDKSGNFTIKTLASEYERQKGSSELQESHAKFVRDVTAFQEETYEQVKESILKTNSMRFLV